MLNVNEGFSNWGIGHVRWGILSRWSQTRVLSIRSPDLSLDGIKSQKRDAASRCSDGWGLGMQAIRWHNYVLCMPPTLLGVKCMHSCQSQYGKWFDYPVCHRFHTFPGVIKLISTTLCGQGISHKMAVLLVYLLLFQLFARYGALALLLTLQGKFIVSEFLHE